MGPCSADALALEAPERDVAGVELEPAGLGVEPSRSAAGAIKMASASWIWTEAGVFALGGYIGWGGPSTGPTLFIVVVSPCRCEPLRAGCCGGEGVVGVS